MRPVGRWSRDTMPIVAPRFARWTLLPVCAKRVRSGDVLNARCCTRGPAEAVRVRRYLRKRTVALRGEAEVKQVGHPALRARAVAVPPGEIPSGPLESLVLRMVRSMRREDLVGLAAPQVGLRKQVLVMELTPDGVGEFSPHLREEWGVSPFPLKVFVNPTLQVLDPEVLVLPEGCASIRGFSACVPRHRSVCISGVDVNGQPVSWVARNWAARVVQHEMDHLSGILYIDRMDTKTFTNLDWKETDTGC
uniref:Peptide deformylase n=1 Tax=Eptatretus burgeri TaxID=7764 RepID=A0A8C4Q2A7_EPTBU